jgi:hypothetical protein
MKTIIAKLKDKLTARRQDAASRYWETVGRLAEEKLSERAAEQALESLEPLLPTLAKTLDDVQADCDALGALRAAEAAVRRRDADRVALKEAARAGVEVEQRAAALEAKARELRQQHAARVEVARAALGQSEGAEAVLAEVRRRLAAGGHPAFRDEGERRERARAVDGAETMLRTADAELSEAEVAARLEPTEGRAARVAHLRDVRARLAARLEALRNGGPLDGGDDGADDGEDLSGIEQGEARTVTP